MTQLPDNWKPLTGDESSRFTEELKRELCQSHKLFGVSARAIARHAKRDDFLFEVASYAVPYVVVHLTWNVESSPKWPTFAEFADNEDFFQNVQAKLYE